MLGVRARAVRGGRSAGQARVPGHVEGDPGRQRAAAHRAGERARRLGGARAVAGQRRHRRQETRRGTRHALPVAQAGQRHLGAAGAEAAPGTVGSDAQSQDAHAGCRRLRFPSV